MDTNCRICKAILTPGHIPKMHPPKFYTATSGKTTPEAYMRMMKEKGWTWNDVEKRWHKENPPSQGER